MPARSNDANEQIPKQKKVPSSLSLVFVMVVNPEKIFRTPKVRKNICSFEAHGSSMYVVVKKLITKLEFVLLFKRDLLYIKKKVDKGKGW